MYQTDCQFCFHAAHNDACVRFPGCYELIWLLGSRRNLSMVIRQALESTHLSWWNRRMCVLAIDH